MSHADLYKVTNAGGWTRPGKSNALLWSEGVTHSADLSLPAKLGTAGVIHAFTSPELALMLHPVYLEFQDPILFRAAGDVVAAGHGLLVGVRTLTTRQRIPMLTVTAGTYIRFGILCAKHACKDEDWRRWADRWLDGSDRSEEAADSMCLALSRSTSSGPGLWSNETGSGRWIAGAAYRAARGKVEAPWAAGVAVQCAARVAPIDLPGLAIRAIAEERAHVERAR